MNYDQGLPREIERKFLLPALPAEIDKLESSHIRQGYLTPVDGDSEVRIRDRDGVHTLAYKKGFGLIRTEIEVAISREAFQALWPATANAWIAKTRYLMPWDDFLLEIDAYEGSLNSLLICEIEYPSTESVQLVELPSWLGKEITDDIRYSNRNLAFYGIPKTKK